MTIMRHPRTKYYQLRLYYLSAKIQNVLAPIPSKLRRVSIKYLAQLMSQSPGGSCCAFVTQIARIYFLCN